MAQAQRELKPGEHVSWSYGAGQAKGQVVEKITENKKLGSRVFKASPEDPKYLVKSDASGKEAIKKPDTLHQIGEDTAGHAGGNSEGEARKHEVGAKEKRDHSKARSSSAERKEAEAEENSKKVQDTGKGSVRASAKAAQDKINVVSDVLMEETAGAEEEDATYEPKKDELEVQDDEEAIATLPTDEEVLVQAEKEAKEEGAENVGDDELGEEEEEDRAYDPAKEEDIVAEPAEDEEVINTLPSDEELIKQMDRENRDVEVDAVAGTEGQQRTSKKKVDAVAGTEGQQKTSKKKS